MDDKNCIEEPKKVNKWGAGGGLYRSINVSIKALNWAIGILIVLLVGVVIYLASSSHYSVTFETNGGESMPSYQCKYGEYIEIEPPSKIGYTFAGWFEDADLTKPYDIKTLAVKDNQTLYAAWTPTLIHVSFDLNGGSVNGKMNTENKEVPFNDLYGTLPTPERTGKSFVGWEYNGSMIKKDTRVTMNGEHTLKAIWK